MRMHTLLIIDIFKRHVYKYMEEGGGYGDRDRETDRRTDRQKQRERSLPSVGCHFSASEELYALWQHECFVGNFAGWL